MSIPRAYAVVSKTTSGFILQILAVFGDNKTAQEWADNANQWYGEDHPLTPLTVVGDILDEPRQFPIWVRRS